LSRQFHYNLLAVSGAFAAQHLTVDAPADSPIEEGEPYVDGNVSLSVGLLDQGTDLDQPLAGFLALQIQISLRHPLPFYYVHPITVTHGSWINGMPGDEGVPGMTRIVFPLIGVGDCKSPETAQPAIEKNNRTGNNRLLFSM
jgi:hypothetical protein